MQVNCDRKRQSYNENGQKMSCNANKNIACTIHCKQETKKTGDNSNACVCLYRSLKLLTDDHSDFVAV